jgi:hypothetical protein
MRERALSANGPLRAGIYAGLAGAVLIDAYLIVTVVVLTHAATLDAFYRYVASAALGKAAYTLPQASHGASVTRISPRKRRRCSRVR